MVTAQMKKSHFSNLTDFFLAIELGHTYLGVVLIYLHVSDTREDVKTNTNKQSKSRCNDNCACIKHACYHLLYTNYKGRTK